MMAVDLGGARTGLAVCDENERICLPAGTVEERDADRLIAKIAEQADLRGAKCLVVGYPRNMDGSEGFKAKECADTARRLGEATGLPTVLWDERCTTVLADRALREAGTHGKKRRAAVDSVAASLILESYLRSRNDCF